MSAITNVSIRRPVATAMAFLILIVIGIVSFRTLPVDLLPKVEYTQLTVSVRYPNVGPEEIEQIITDPIENVVSGLPNLERMTSESREGRSRVRLEFGRGTNIDEAANDLRAALDELRDELPVEAEADGVVVRQVVGEVGGPGGHERVVQRDRFVAAEHEAHRHAAVVATEAHLAVAAGLIDAGIRRAALVDAVIGGRVVTVPQRRLRAGVVGRVAEDADLILIQRANRAGAADGEVVLGVDHGFVGPYRGRNAKCKMQNAKWEQPRRVRGSDHFANGVDSHFAFCISHFAFLKY